MLDALERIDLFRTQAADSHRRVENIGGDLDSAISLLDLRQSREAVDAVGTRELCIFLLRLPQRILVLVCVVPGYWSGNGEKER